MSKSLILVPTDLERRMLAPSLMSIGDVELCGFGPVAAAARTAALVAARRPTRVVLVGIAGSLDPSLEVSVAYQFREVACYGVGAGSGEAFISAGTMGWPHWPGDPATASSAIGDVIALPASTEVPPAGLLVTACAASHDPQDAALRRKLFPGAVAEDMEGFGVAVACHLACVPLTIVRGISNTAGDRDTSRWHITAALNAAAALAREILEVAR